MAEERERAQEEDPGGADAPFDENPPVDPSAAQVGNSRARFFVPSDEGEDERAEGEDEESQ